MSGAGLGVGAVCERRAVSQGDHGCGSCWALGALSGMGAGGARYAVSIAGVVGGSGGARYAVSVAGRVGGWGLAHTWARARCCSRISRNARRVDLGVSGAGLGVGAVCEQRAVSQGDHGSGSCWARGALRGTGAGGARYAVSVAGEVGCSGGARYALRGAGGVDGRGLAHTWARARCCSRISRNARRVDLCVSGAGLGMGGR